MAAAYPLPPEEVRAPCQPIGRYRGGPRLIELRRSRAWSPADLACELKKLRDGLPSVRSLAHMIQLDWETGKHRPARATGSCSPPSTRPTNTRSSTQAVPKTVRRPVQ